ALLRLGHLVGEMRYLDAAERALRAGFSSLRQMPLACCAMLRALNDFLHPRTHVVVRFDGASEESTWRAALAAQAHRRCDIYLIPAQAGKLPDILAAQTYTSGGAAYVCRGTQCEPALSEPDALNLASSR
ncbi:MAG TPA: hypothetical protein VFN69_01260, partial [Rudaea sp.]|nr:hypothetical protein [Rudaea sp.]